MPLESPSAFIPQTFGPGLIHLIASRLQHRYAPAPQPAAGKYVGVEAGADLAFIASIW
jgi:hypothetical protein